MAKVLVTYWSGTGNTEQMAQMLAQGAKDAGAEVRLEEMENIDVKAVEDCDALAMGCPSMGAEELEDTIVLPFVESIEGVLSGKKVALFGSYGWGDGEWMKDWEERTKKAGADLVNGEGVICLEAPDDEAKGKLEELGKALC